MMTNKRKSATVSEPPPNPETPSKHEQFWLSTGGAAQIANTMPRTISRWVRNGWLIHTRSADGSLMVCRDSLLRILRKQRDYMSRTGMYWFG